MLPDKEKVCSLSALGKSHSLRTKGNDYAVRLAYFCNGFRIRGLRIDELVLAYAKPQHFFDRVDESVTRQEINSSSENFSYLKDD